MTQQKLEVYTLDLDWDFLMHLALPDSWQVIRSEGVSPELIEDEIVLKAYEFQTEHQRVHGKPATPTVLEHEFSEDGVNLVEPQSAVGDLIGRLRERYANNRGRQAILDVTQRTISDPAQLAKAMLEEGRRLYEILTPKGKSFTQDDFDKALDRYNKRVVRGRGPSLGFKELDEYYYGQLGLTFMVGPPKGGKSWFTLQAVFQNIKDGKNVHLHSLELPAEETDMRLRCLAAQVPYHRYLHGQLDARDKKALEESSEILQSWGKFTIEKPKAGDRSVESLVERARDNEVDCLFIDQLQYIENDKGIALGSTNDTKDYFDVINRLRDYSDDGPIWCVHQFNRSVMSADALPDMQQIKGSSAVEECSTLVLGLWANKEMRKSNLVHIGSLASRNYAPCTWEAQMLMRTTCGISLVGKVEE